MPYSPSRYAVHGQHALLVEHDRVDHLRRRRTGRVPRRGAEQLDDLAAALRRSLDELRDALRGRRASSAERRRRSSPRPPRPSGRRGRRAPRACTSLTDDPGLPGDERREARVSRIPALPNTRSFGKPETLLATWHIASSGFETTIRIASGDCADRLLGDRADDLLVRRHEVVAAHPGLARHAGGDHDDVGAGGRLVAVRADTFGS